MGSKDRAYFSARARTTLPTWAMLAVYMSRLAPASPIPRQEPGALDDSVGCRVYSAALNAGPGYDKNNGYDKYEPILLA